MGRGYCKLGVDDTGGLGEGVADVERLFFFFLECICEMEVQYGHVFIELLLV